MESIGSGNGKVAFWNGNSDLEDWKRNAGDMQPTQNLFLNVLDYLCKEP